MAIHGRNDQDEYFWLPINNTGSLMALSGSASGKEKARQRVLPGLRIPLRWTCDQLE
jgi:hypothetical protein